MTKTKPPESDHHHQRTHAPWAASSTARNWNCAGALAMAEVANVPDVESYPAACGTACHQVSEKSLRSGADAIALLDTFEKTKEHNIEVDEELCVTAQEYIDYCRKQLADNPGATMKLEQYYSLEKLKPPIEAGGTSDCVLHYPAKRMLEVVDLKGGRGVVVEVKGNMQAKTYALCTLLNNPGLDIERVTSTIVQPRAAHKDGRTRSETYHVADLVEWTADLLVRMRASVLATLERKQVEAGTMAVAVWNAKHLKAGGHCTFCRAEGMCPALEQKALDAVAVWYDDNDAPQITNAPEALSPEQLAKSLDLLDMVEAWCNARRAYCHTKAEAGMMIPDYQLSESIGHRKWLAADDKALVKALFLAADISGDDIFAKRKIKSPAQIEKVLGKKSAHLIEKLVHRPVTGTSLVRADKTMRPALPSRPERYFEPVEKE